MRTILIYYLIAVFWLHNSFVYGQTSQQVMIAQNIATSGGGIALVAHCVATNTGTCTINSTGATLIVVATVVGGGTTFSAPTENKSNTFQAPASASWAFTANNAGQIYYIFGPTVGSGHVFTGHSSSTIYFVSAWSGTLTTSGVFDTGNANSGSGTSLAVGSVTPSATNELLVSMAINSDNGSTWTVPTSFTELDPTASFGREDSAYLVDSASSVINPTWTIGTAVAFGGAVAVFKHP